MLLLLFNISHLKTDHSITRSEKQIGEPRESQQTKWKVCNSKERNLFWRDMNEKDLFL